MSKNSFLKNTFFIMTTMIFVGPFFAAELPVVEYPYDLKKPTIDHSMSETDYRNGGKDHKIIGSGSSKIDIPKVVVSGEKITSKELPLTFQEGDNKNPLSKDDVVLNGQVVDIQNDIFTHESPVVVRSDFSNTTAPDGSEKVKKAELVVERMQKLTQEVKKEQVQLKEDFFRINMIIIDSITDGTSLQQGKIASINALLNGIVSRQDLLDKELLSLDQSYNSLALATNNFLPSRVDELQNSRAQLEKALETLWNITVDSYKKNSSGFQMLRENLLKTDDDKNKIKELDQCVELFDTHVKQVVEKKDGKEKEKCFFLAGKIEGLREKFNLLKQDYKGFKKRVLINKDFNEAIQTVKELLDELKNDKEAMANCPFVVQQRRELTKQLNTFLKEIHDIPTQK